MSLTSILKNKEVSNKFKKEFPLPKFNLEKEILAPPLTTNYILVGVAFDYLLRFYLESINPKAVTREWVAMDALIVAGKGLIPGNYKMLGTDPMKYLETPPEHFVKKYLTDTEYKMIICMANILKDAEIRNENFLKTKEVSDQLLRSCILLAQLDPIVRSGYVDPNIGVVDEKDIRDLKNLISLVTPTMFEASKYCVLNPTFGKGSHMVGGADADLVIDDTLIDVKTTKHLRFDRGMLNQLIGYYLLSQIGGIDGVSPKQKVKRLGVYFSRYGELYTFAVSDLLNEKNIDCYITWLQPTGR